MDDQTLVFIGDETVTTDANPMPLVHSIYYIDRALLALVDVCIDCYHLITYKDTKLNMFFFCCIGFLLQPT